MSLKQKAKHFILVFFYIVKNPRRFYRALSKRGQKWAMRGFIFFLIILVAVPVAFWYQANHAKAAWFDEGWMYRKAIPVTNNTTVQNNVYISLTTDTSDTSKFQNDCGDIRFTNLHGAQLPYYIASGCGTASTVIHVNFDVFPAGASTIYIYYGNPSAPNGFSASDFATEASNYAVGSLGTEEKGPGPLADWKFDEGQGNTAYNSTSQTGINGTLQNSPTWKQEADCVSGKCLQYNGTNQYVSVDDTGTALDFDAAKPYTWSAWINYSGFPTGKTQQCFLSKDGFGVLQKVDGFNLCLNQTSSTADPVVCRGSATTGLTCSTGLGLGLVPNIWTHVEIQYDGASNWKTYVNGAYKGSQSLAVTSDAASKYFAGAGVSATGNGAQTPNYFFQGKIDTVKIYPYQRSNAQVATDYNSGKSGASTSEGTSVSIGDSPKWMTDGLVSHWKMDETSGTTVADASGNGHTGTLTNAQETGTVQTGSNTTTITDSANAALSASDDAYKNMILQITSGALNGTQRTITGYTGASKTFTFAALGSDPTGTTYQILHQTGGKFGNGLAFEGKNDYIDAGTAPTFVNTNQYSWSSWIKWTNFTKTTQCYFSKDIPGGVKTTGYNLCLNQTGSTADPVICKGSSTLGNLDCSTGLNLSLPGDTWTNLSTVYDGAGNWQIYVNGKNMGTENLPVTSDSTAKYFIGCGNSTATGPVQSPDYFFTGQIDDVRMYNRTLSPEELKQLSDWAPGPVGRWKMDDGVKGNNQTIVDSSGNGNNGTTNWGANASGMDCTQSGKFGGGCQFDGTDDRISIGDPASGVLDFGNGSFSYGLWVNVASSEGQYDMPWEKGGSSGGRPGYDMEFGTGTWSACIVGETATTKCSSFGNEALGQWGYYEAVVDRSVNQLIVYKNGVKVSSLDITGLGSVFSNLPGYIGGNSSGTYPFQGLIDDFHIYNYARSAKQVVEDMNAGHPVGGSPIGSQVGYWKFDEGKGQTAYDSSPNHQDLTLSYDTGGSNPTWTNSGKFGRALNFTRANKSSAYINDTPTLSLTSDLTLSAWIKPTSNSAGTKYDIIDKWNSSYSSFLLAQYGSELRMYIDGALNYKSTSGLGLQTGQWYYVAGVYNASAQAVTLYVNGKDAGGSVIGTIPASIADGVGKLFIGDAPTPITDYFDGTIDEVKIYASALTPDQITLDMNQGKVLQLGGQTSVTGATGQAAKYCVPGDATSCSPPVGEWNFNELSGGTAHDTSGNGSDGTWHGTGSHWTDVGQEGSAGTFNGTDDYVDCGNNASLQITNGTVSAWIKTSNPGAGYRGIAGSLGAYAMYLKDNIFGVYDNTAGTFRSSGVNLADGKWHNVSMAFSSGASNGTNLYVDGGLVLTTTMTNGSYGNFSIGMGQGGVGQVINGQIDDVKTFNYLRTPAQIAWDFNRGKPVGWWKLDEGEGTSAYDSSANANTGTLTNMDPPNDWVAGKFGKALDFDGTNDYISAGTAPTFDSTKPTSWSAWIKWTNFAKSTQCYFSKDKNIASKTTGYNLCLNQTSSTADPVICKGSGSVVGNLDCSSGLNLNLPSGSWINLAVVYDGAGNWQIYENGQYMGAETLSVSSETTMKYFIGAGNAKTGTDGNQVPDYFFTGQIDDVRMYNYALRPEQIRQVMNEGSAIRFGE